MIEWREGGVVETGARSSAGGANNNGDEGVAERGEFCRYYLRPLSALIYIHKSHDPVGAICHVLLFCHVLSGAISYHMRAGTCAHVDLFTDDAWRCVSTLTSTLTITFSAHHHHESLLL